jgi:hypothetical protein
VALSGGLESHYDTLLYAVTLAGARALSASRRPGNAIGWLFCGFAVFNAWLSLRQRTIASSLS